MSSRPARTFMPCPHCNRAAQLRSSNALTPMIRESFMACRNVVCGHTFVVMSSIDRTLSPSAIPRADVDLKVSTFAEALRESERLKAQEQKEATDSAVATGEPV